MVFVEYDGKFKEIVTSLNMVAAPNQFSNNKIL